MGFLRALAHYASDAWHWLTGIPGNVGSAFVRIWHFIASVHSLLDHLFSTIVRGLLSWYLSLFTDIISTLEGQNRALNRVRYWIYKYQIVPLRTFLLLVIARIAARLQFEIITLTHYAQHLYNLSIAYARRLVLAEQNARIKDVNAARAYALKLVNAMHATLEREAADAYNANTRQRVSVISKIIDDLVTRNPAIRLILKDLITLLLDFIGAENPLERAAINVLLTQIINHLGIDKVMGQLLAALIGPLAGTPRARGIHDAVGDLAQRTGTLEGQWADFMTAGGPEVEQAGRGWKQLTGVGVNVALLGFFGLAVADPAGWAVAVADTAGAAVNGTAAAAARLIRSA